VLRWKAATDNSGLIGAYLVYANGKRVKTLPASARSADLGAYKTSDSRSFQVAARDAAGNVGRKTKALVIVPGVKTLTVVEAKSRLSARGLKSGTLSYSYSSTVAAGRVIGTARTGVVPKGTAVGLTVSRGHSNRSPAYVPGTTTGTGGTTAPPTSFGGTPTGTSTTGSVPTTGLPADGTSLDPSSSPVPDASSVADAERESFVPVVGDGPSSNMRRLLGLFLLAGAFLAAGASALRARRRLRPVRAEEGSDESLRFWDERLLQAAASAVRRLAGRRAI
jgi:hypothetical protein